MIRKWLCLLLTLVLVLSAVQGLAEGQPGEALEYLYTFTPGTILEGEGTTMIRELLEAMRIRFVRQKGESDDVILLQLISNNEEAFSLTAGEMAGEEFAMTCSLLGGNKLTLQRSQISSFLMTLVQALGERGLLRGKNLEKMGSIANRAGTIITNYLDREPDNAPDTGIDITPYLNKLTSRATATEQQEIPAEERDGSGAVIRTSYLLSEEQRRDLVNRAMDKVVKLPVIGDQLNNGSLRIGGQVITEEFIRSVFGDTPGEVTMDVWQDADGQLVRLVLNLPDLSGVVTDPEFAKTRGVELSIARTYGEGKNLTSITTFALPGLEGDLLSMRLERTPCGDIPPMKAKKVHAVGEMTPQELSELIRSMSLTIFGNAANMVLTLPDCIGRILIQRILK